MINRIMLAISTSKSERERVRSDSRSESTNESDRVHSESKTTSKSGSKQVREQVRATLIESERYRAIPVALVAAQRNHSCDHKGREGNSITRVAALHKIVWGMKQRASTLLHYHTLSSLSTALQYSLILYSQLLCTI